MDPRFTLSQQLLQINAIKLSPQKPFQWASGLYSPIYCDNRMALSFPEVRDFIKSRFLEEIKQQKNVDFIAGVATAGIAHGALIADALNLPFIYVRAKAKKHGRQNKIEGFYTPGQSCVVIEDLISTGGSALSAVSALRDAGLHVIKAYAIFSYNFEKAETNFLKADCPYVNLTDYKTLLELAVQTSYINKDQFATLSKWRENPEKWSNEFINSKTK